MAVSRWPTGWWLWALSFGCGGGGASLELPPEASTFGVAVRVETNGSETYAYVDAVSSPRLLEPPAEGAEVAFLFYAATLDELELVPSRVYPNEGRFKTPDAVRLLESSGEDSSGWRSLPSRALPAWIEPYRLPGVCRLNRLKPINLPPSTTPGRSNEVSGLAPIDEARVLISTYEGRFFRATWSDDGNPKVAEVAVAGERDAQLGGFRSATRLWFGGPRGLLGSIDLEASRDTTELYVERRGILPASEPELGRTILDIDGDPDRDDDIFMLTYDGTVLHFDGSELSTLGQIVGTSTRQVTLLDRREIRWRGPRQAVAVTWVEAGQYPIYNFEVGSTPRPLVLPGPRESLPTALAYGPGGLFVAETTRGADRRYTSRVSVLPEGASDWSLYTEVSFAVLGLAMERYDGVAAGGEGGLSAGVLASQTEGAGEACSSTPAAAPLRDIVRTGVHSAVAVGFSFRGEANQLLWIR